MRQVSRLRGIIFVTMLLSGCVEVDTVIKVKSDGSGTIEETFLINKEASQMMGGMMTGMAEGMAEGMVEMGEQMGVGENQDMKQELKQGLKKEIKKEGRFFNEEKLKEKASEMGEGVKLVSAEKLTTPEKEGYKAIYAFTDIDKLKCNMKSENMASGKTEPQKPELVTFQFTKGDPATLMVRLPHQEPDEKPEHSTLLPDTTKTDIEEDMNPPQGMEMVKAMFKGFRMSMAIEVEGDIIETNATYREGSRITLMEMDLGKLMENEEKFKKFTETNPQTFEEMKKMQMEELGELGIKVESNEEVKIRFKKGL